MGACSQAQRAAAAALAISARRYEVSFAARARPLVAARVASAGARIAAFVAVSASASNCRIRCSASVRISSLCRSASAFFAWRAYLPTGSRSRECPRRRRSGEPQGSLASMGRRPRRTSPRSHRARRRRFLQAWLSSENQLLSHAAQAWASLRQLTCKRPRGASIEPAPPLSGRKHQPSCASRLGLSGHARLKASMARKGSIVKRAAVRKQGREWRCATAHDPRPR